jgi:hypothetical protein
VLAMVYQRFRLRIVPGQQIEMQPGITLRHRYGLQMDLVEDRI